MSPAADDPPGAGEPVSSDPRAVVTSLMDAHGASIHRYLVAMLGPEDAQALWPTIFGHLAERVAEGIEPNARRLTTYALAHNRCLERCRSGGSPGLGPQGLLDAAEIEAVRAMAQLRPVGRDAFVLRCVTGLPWDELSRVCGVPRVRPMNRVNRAWRRLGHETDPQAQGPALMERPTGAPLTEQPDQWSAIREQARHLLAVRELLRRVVARHAPAPGWVQDTWIRLDEQREQARLDAETRAVERAAKAEAEAVAKAEAERVEAEAKARGGSEGVAGTHHHASVEGDAEQDVATAPRTRPWGWIAIGVALAVIGLAARWLTLG